MAAQILIVEDEEDLLEVLEHRLNKEGYETLGFLSTKNVRQAIAEEHIDLILMDRNLPDIEGSEFIALLRDQGMEIPVIFLSAKDSKYQIEEGFLRGADDYITKPFEMQELFYRIKAVLRRTQAHQQKSTLSFRDIELDLRSREIFIDGREVELTKLEFDLLYTFIENKNTVLKRDHLLKHVWGKNEHYQGRTVNVAINRLKEKIDPDKTKDYIKTVRGIGYTIH
ncbi:MAG: response regulator transcription factor [Thiovulaceae bacterium]|nr:response regulator transcription factor [Sulfurimonadaceae bacterium]